jgi:hypothetical protein
MDTTPSEIRSTAWTENELHSACVRFVELHVHSQELSSKLSTIKGNIQSLQTKLIQTMDNFKTQFVEFGDNRVSIEQPASKASVNKVLEEMLRAHLGTQQYDAFVEAATLKADQVHTTNPKRKLVAQKKGWTTIR